MKLAAAIALLLAPGLAAVRPAGPQQFCVPPPVRTTPRQPYERFDKWQRDQRTIA